VHDASDAGGRRRLDQRTDGGGVDGAIRGARQTGLPIDGRNVVDDFDIPCRARERRGIVE
jgi:hypothetical protein